MIKLFGLDVLPGYHVSDAGTKHLRSVELPRRVPCVGDPTACKRVSNCVNTKHITDITCIYIYYIYIYIYLYICVCVCVCVL